MPNPRSRINRREREEHMEASDEIEWAVQEKSVSKATTSAPLYRDFFIPQEVKESQEKLESKYRQKFTHFIKTYTHHTHSDYTFKHQALNLAKGATKLQVNFNYLLDGLRQDKQDKVLLGLCLHIGNNNSHDWLSVSRGELLNRDWLKNEGISNISDLNRLVNIEFWGKSRSIVQLKDLFGDKLRPAARTVPLMRASRSVYASTTRGRLALKLAVMALIAQFKEDRWYEDDIDIDDIFLMNDMESCYICKIPVRLSSLNHLSPSDAQKMMATGKANNLKSLWFAFERFFTSPDGHALPIYFSTLKTDMIYAMNNVSEAWFLNYLEKNFCWASSMCRKNFTCDFQLTTKSFDLKHHPRMKSLLSEAPPDFDWRVSIKQTGDDLLNSVFWYGIDLNQLGLNLHKEDIYDCQWSEIPQIAYEKARPNTIAAVIEYKRNLIEHLCDHLKRAIEEKRECEVQITDFDEIELFASSSQPQVEHRILRSLMQTCPAEFESLMEFYGIALSSKRDLPSYPNLNRG